MFVAQTLVRGINVFVLCFKYICILDQLYLYYVSILFWEFVLSQLYLLIQIVFISTIIYNIWFNVIIIMFTIMNTICIYSLYQMHSISIVFQLYQLCFNEYRQLLLFVSIVFELCINCTRDTIWYNKYNMLSSSLPISLPVSSLSRSRSLLKFFKIHQEWTCKLGQVCSSVRIRPISCNTAQIIC